MICISSRAQYCAYYDNGKCTFKKPCTFKISEREHKQNKEVINKNEHTKENKKMAMCKTTT